MNRTEFVKAVQMEDLKETNERVERAMACVYGVEDLKVQEIDIKPDADNVFVYVGWRGRDSMITFSLDQTSPRLEAVVEIYFGDLAEEMPGNFAAVVCQGSRERGIAPVLRNNGLAFKVKVEDVQGTGEIEAAYEKLRENCQAVAAALSGETEGSAGIPGTENIPEKNSTIN